MSPFLCRLYDRALGRLIAQFVRRPKQGFQEPDCVPDTPDSLSPSSPLALKFFDPKKESWKFECESPVASPWPESRVLRGRAFGPMKSDAAVIVLHGACDNEYTYSGWTGSAFVQAGFRALVPAAPSHLDRRPAKTFSGAPMFWSTKLTVAGMAQWLAEIQGLVGYLRQDGVKTVGLIGYSIGSLTAGLAATLWPDLDFVCLLAPVGHHLAALPVSRVARTIWPWLQDVSTAETALMDRWAAVNRQPVARRTVFLMTLFDALQPIELQRAWWEAWKQPESHEYRHGHMSILFCRQLYRDLRALALDLRKS